MKRTVILASLLLAGCATHWSKDGGTQQQFAADMSQCLALANGATAGGFTNDVSGSLMQTASSMNVRDMCMNGRGYTKQ